MFRKSSLLILLFIVSFRVEAGELTGFIAIDNRNYINSPKHAGQKSNNGPTLVLEPEYYHLSQDERSTFTFNPFFRLDPYDGKRTHFDIRQLDLLYARDDWELGIGLSKIFWGVTESNHLVDIINQTDTIENLDGEDKLGQPMVQLGIFPSFGNIRLFYLPYFRERTFSGVKGRLRSSIPIETDNAIYESGAKEFHPDFAIRYQNSFGNWDIGLANFYGTSREARLVADTNKDGDNILIPAYDIINQTSTDIQYTKEGWLLKLESIYRSGQGRSFAAATGGFEYSFYSIVDTNMDLGLLAEYQYDDRSADAPGTFADNDLFLGTRLTLNDVNDSSLLAGIIIDTKTNSNIYSLEAERRIGNNWKIELKANLSSNIKSNSPESGISKDDLIQLRLARYF